MKDKEYLQIIELIKISLNLYTDYHLLKDANYEKIYKLSKKQGLSNLTYYGINKINPPINKELYTKWENDCINAIVYDVYHQEAYKQIKKQFNKKQIEYMMLKGIILKKLYPTTDMRTMGDIDILIHPHQRHQVKEIMNSLDYTTLVYQKNNEDIYEKNPDITIEIHTELFEKKSIYYHSYKNIWNKLDKYSNSTEYKFNLDDFYIFIITHFAKHYYHAGSGIRNIIDIYLFRKKYLKKLNKTYIETKLKEINLLQFEQDILSLIDVWFNNKKHNEATKEMQQYIFESGIKGKQENIYYNQIKKYKTKTNYIIHRIFLPLPEMKNHYPILNKIIILLPILYTYRILISILKKPQLILKELKNIIKIK